MSMMMGANVDVNYGFFVCFILLFNFKPYLFSC
eukprot:UN07692